jgi:hypothetical protein
VGDLDKSVKGESGDDGAGDSREERSGIGVESMLAEGVDSRGGEGLAAGERRRGGAMVV